MKSPVFALVVLLSCVAGPATASVEPEPSLPPAQLAEPGTPLFGPDWRVASPTPVQGYLGRFLIRTEGGDRVEAAGRELLAVRTREMAAIARLAEISKGEVFAGAIAKSAQDTGRAVVRVVTNPVETAKGIPAGIGRLLKGTARKVRRVAVAVGDAARREDEPGGAGDTPAIPSGKDFAKELAGVNKARRALAQAMGIDPYTGNPLLQARLEELAWASVAGGLSIDLALGAVSGLAGDLLSVTGELDSLVWDLSPGDIRDRLETDLIARGSEPMAAREFLRNGAFTPTLQLAFVGSLRALGRPRGEAAVLELATDVRDEVHARFLIQQLRMLARHAAKDDPLVALEAMDASIAATTRRGARLVTLPVDYLSWTEQVELGAAPRRGRGATRLVVAGTVSPLAKARLTSAGWIVADGVGLPR